MTSNTEQGRGRARLVTVAAAVVAALVIWIIAKVAGADFTSPKFGDSDPFDINAGYVITTAALAGLAGWALLAILERATSRARTIWTVVAAVVLVFSLGGPLSGEDAEGSTRFALALMHVTVGLILIVGLRRTSTGDALAPAGGSPASTARA